jgi:hypothetical protein
MKDQKQIFLFGLKFDVVQQVSKQMDGNISMVQDNSEARVQGTACKLTCIHIEEHTCLRERRGLRLNLRVFTTTASDILDKLFL